MSQFGMHLPGGQAQRGSSMTVYTGLLFLAVVALAAACIFVYLTGRTVGKDGDPLGKQVRNQIKLQQSK
ncbi:MAG: hypothetical protein H7210_08185 [Pyrinomonadaceae bacterium]|nr:hypothetical protein [Phycisphaerales bacterium]